MKKLKKLMMPSGVDADSNNDDNSMQAILSTTISTSNSNVEL
ncbi:14536_t:CDS:2, partial [Entrophospora sp. SA101]